MDSLCQRLEKVELSDTRDEWKILLTLLSNISSNRVSVSELQTTNQYYLEKIDFTDTTDIYYDRLEKIEGLLVNSLQQHQSMFIIRDSYEAYQMMYELIKHYHSSEVPELELSLSSLRIV
tara:strand:+ start:247 stop:606 length:360 start_codon:yes stop_codon:yes gene_type:complete